MPKVVDVLERRGVIVAAVLAVLERGGADAVTVRAVAQEAGLSPGLLHHYFPGGKPELLHAAVTAAVDRGTERMLAVLDEQHGLVAVRSVALELLPVVPERRAAWAAWVALWGHILTDARLREEQRERLEAWRALLTVLLDQAVAAGELPPGADTTAVALRLAGMLDGLGLHALVAPELLPPAVLAEHLDAFLATVRA
jgi:AcrR family transcriptional regulator